MQGWKFIEELFGSADSWYYSVRKNFRYILWNHCPQTHMRLHPLLHLILNNIICTIHATEVSVGVFWIMHRIINNLTLSMDELIARDMVRIAKTL